VAPIALIVTRTGILIEVAILATGRIVLSRNATVVGVFAVVAWARALRVVRINQPIAVVVQAVAACVHLAFTSRGLAGAGRPAAAARAVATAWTVAARALASAAERSGGGYVATRGVITPDLDVLGTAESAQARAPAENEGPCTKLRHRSALCNHLGAASSTMRWCAEPGNALEKPAAR